MIGTEGTRLLLRKARPKETPQAQKRRGGSRTARGKRVPEVEINVPFTNPQITVSVISETRPLFVETEHIPMIYGLTLNEEVLNGFGTSNLRMCFSFGHPLIKVRLNQHFPINKILVNPFKTHFLFLPFTRYAIWL
ncbi:hypothetical protein [Peribacillus simplex]|uniref:hypothetical protein n=1 Tax=Peribacillus TaxID=2675229 RepID=UPI0036DCAFA3